LIGAAPDVLTAEAGILSGPDR
ncbi:MAG: hypothetical protein QOF59_589, partial [Actinomycetota bacterium]|nr:hypothetical protein [Actinomycetota bacterium]